MGALEDASASILKAKQWLLQPHASLEHVRKHQLEPTGGDLMNPANGEEWHVTQQSVTMWKYDVDVERPSREAFGHR